MLGIGGKPLSVGPGKLVERRSNPLHRWPKPVQKLGASCKAVKLRDIVERRPVRRQQMGLLIIDHLHAVLGGSQPAVSLGEVAGEVRGEMPGIPKRGNCVERRAGPKLGITPSVDQLLGMNVELDLANSAAPALEVESGTERLPLRIMVADSLADRPDLLDRPEIERSPPDERLD